jgi:hypothetical protein
MVFVGAALAAMEGENQTGDQAGVVCEAVWFEGGIRPDAAGEISIRTLFPTARDCSPLLLLVHERRHPLHDDWRHDFLDAAAKENHRDSRRYSVQNRIKSSWLHERSVILRAGRATANDAFGLYALQD